MNIDPYTKENLIEHAHEVGKTFFLDILPTVAVKDQPTALIKAIEEHISVIQDKLGFFTEHNVLIMPDNDGGISPFPAIGFKPFLITKSPDHPINWDLCVHNPRAKTVEESFTILHQDYNPFAFISFALAYLKAMEEQEVESPSPVC